MNFDAFSVAAIGAELRAAVLNGRVQRVTQINSLTFGLEIYVHPLRHYLVLSAEPQAPRLHLTLRKVRRGRGNETPLLLSLRKYMRGAHLVVVEQPPYERILHLHFNGSAGPTILVVELLGTRSNLILLEPDATILGVARLSKPVEEGARPSRVLVPGQLYEPPPPQEKLAPAALTERALRLELDEASPEFETARLLPQITSGVSPLLAREIVYRATGAAGTRVGQLSAVGPLLAAFTELFGHLAEDRWEPTLALDEEGAPLAFAPYPLTHLPTAQPAETFSAAVETFFEEAASGYAAAKVPLAGAIEEARQRLARRRERLNQDAAAQADPEILKTQGEAILAYAHEVRPGQTQLVVEWVPGQPSLKIPLDPALSASDNAQNYFNRYRKAQRAGGEIPAQFEKIDLEESYLEQLEQDLEMAEDRTEIDAVAAALDEAGYRKFKRRGQKRPPARPLRLVAPGGATVWVGKNARQNAELTFDRAAPDDLWLHARGVPGAHVLIPTAQGLPSEDDVFWAAGVTAYYSRARRDTAVDVIVTLKKHVRAIKGAAPGLVTYRHESTLRVTPEEPELDDEE